MADVKKLDVTLDPAIFGIQPNVPVMHQVVTAQLAARRSGTQSTKTRAEVRGGGKKPWRQKGTGRARQGSTRAPHWSGGGVALGPKPRSYAQKTPKKMIQLALRSALSDRAGDGKVLVIDEWGFASPKTREGKAALAALGLTGKVLVVLGNEDEIAWKTFRNLVDVQIIHASELNAYDILCNDWVVFTKLTLPGGEAAANAAKADDVQTSAPVSDEPATSVTDEPATSVTEPVAESAAEPVAEAEPMAEAVAPDIDEEASE